MQSVLALSHVPFEDLGTLGLALRERGALIDFIDASVAELASLDVVTPDLLVILGGPIGVYEVDAYPFLRAEIDLIRLRLDAKLPTLGICLGAQLMACALGARVYPGAMGKEIGWSAVAPGPDMAADPFLAHLIAEAPAMFHFHGDTFDLPSGARLLARSDKYQNQAFAIGNYALGFQFHPEVTADGLERWYVGHACELAAAKIDIAGLRNASREVAPKLEQAALRFWRSWLDQRSL
ncbi:glutamine amidotransferase [Methylocystis parvus]|uniref:Glutamine amidotransferase n=1 Tax=Methylocystis parvus TaxID=134 RepID=A0A6B8M0P4_9HYPH|nr:glutamine amidotransferase [Methylocystis parvus]QGM96411.1 glutamine amidotransferase [Methylocystis parvus]WBJ99747.1 glutamine amidotransferase [Methylocystis parvus OBBP]